LPPRQLSPDRSPVGAGEPLPPGADGLVDPVGADPVGAGPLAPPAKVAWPDTVVEHAAARVAHSPASTSRPRMGDTVTAVADVTGTGGWFCPC
jgi:hypothetical protein